jgi:hypothetical protein
VSEATLNLIYVPIAVISGVIGCSKLRELLRGFRDYLMVITISSYMGVTAFLSMSPVVWHPLGRVSGVPALGSFTAYLSIFGYAAFHHILVLMWGRDSGAITASRLSRKTRVLGVGYALIASGMTVCFLTAHTGPARPWSFDVDLAHDPAILAFLCLYAGGCLFALWNAARECAKCADHLLDNGSQSVETIRGLRWLSIGTVFIWLSFVPKAIGFLAAAAGHRELDALDTTSPLIGSFGALFNQAGYLGPAISAWLRERRDLRALRPLWNLVVPENAVHLARPGVFAETFGVGVRFHMFRRVIEISDALVLLRPWMDAAPAERVRAAAARQGLTEDETEAAAAVAVVVDAVHRKRRDEPAQRTAAAQQLLPHVAPTMERERLVRMARALDAPVLRSASCPLTRRSRPGAAS